MTEAAIVAALATTGNVSFAAMSVRPRNSGARSMKPRECETARPVTMRDVMQMAATAARMAATAKLAMSRKVQTAARVPRLAVMINGLLIAATPARTTDMAKLVTSAKKVQTAAMVPRPAAIRGGLLMAATLARTTDVAKVAMSAKAVKTTGGIKKGIIVSIGIVGFEVWW